MERQLIYIATSCLKGGRDLFRTLDRYVEAGIKNIELGSTHSYVEDIEQKLIDFQNSNKVNFVVHNYFPPKKGGFIINLASENKEIRENSIEHVKTALNICEALNAKFYAVHAGFRVDPDKKFYFKGTPIPYEKSYEIFMNSLREIIPCAKNVGVSFSVENNTAVSKRGEFVGNYVLMQKSVEFKEMFRELSEYANFGMLLDVGHLNVAATWYKFDREKFIDNLYEHIAGLHLHENNGKTDLHQNIKEESWFLEKIVRKKAGKIPITLESSDLTIEEILDSKKILEGYLK